MIRRLFSIVLISVLVISCKNAGKKEVTSKADDSKTGEKVEFASLIANPESYVGKNIIVKGKVVHVCTETGKKMFIVGENPDVRLYVAAGENISKFPMELLGSEVEVEGIITKVGGSALAANEVPMKNMKNMHKGDENAKMMGSDSCETETALAGQPSLANIIMEYKSHIVK
jgi:ribosomal protein S8E